VFARLAKVLDTGRKFAMTATPTQPPSAARSKTQFYARLLLFGWLALFVIASTAIYAGGFRPLGLVVEMAAGMLLPLAVLSPLVFWLTNRWPINVTAWRSHLWKHLLASLVFIAANEVISSLMLADLRPKIVAADRMRHQSWSATATAENRQPDKPPMFLPPELQAPPADLGAHVLRAVARLPAYWVLAAFAHALLVTMRLREREQQAAELAAHLAAARLNGLRTQLQPHFLFNTLNSISALIPQDAKLANEMVLNLSDLLRMTLRDPQRGEIPLSEELKLLGHYVDIQKLRFGERLRFKLEADESALSFPVPPLLLQPLVENAIRYGVEASEQPEQIGVRVRLAEQTLALEVTNTCHIAGDEVSSTKNSTGVGLANTQARLAALYGAAQTFQFGPLPDGGFRVWMRIPPRGFATNAP
jgi:hypothetical protein